MKKINYLSFLIVLLTMIITSLGLFYSTGGGSYPVENIYGDKIEIFGDGIYKYDSVLKAGGNKGTDLVMLIVSIFFAFFTIISKKRPKYGYIQVGLLTGILYYSACLVFGVTFNRLFPLYVLLFSTSLFTMIFLLSKLIREDHVVNILNKKMRGTAIFIILSGCSVLIWLQFIIPAIINDIPMETIEIYTTEPTFVLDLAIILPTYLGCGIALLKKKEIGYKLAPVLLTFIVLIGLLVIGQTLMQLSFGVEIGIKELVGLVFSFITLGVIAIILDIKFLKKIN
jgi:hypothetical protein